MNSRIFVLSLMLLSNALFAIPATNQILQDIFSDCFNAWTAAVDIPQPDLERLLVSRNHFNRVLNNLRSLQMLSDIELVCTHSDQPIPDLKYSIGMLIAKIPIYEQLIRDFDAMLAKIERERMQVAEIEKRWEELFAFFGSVVNTEENGVETMCNICMQLE